MPRTSAEALAEAVAAIEAGRAPAGDARDVLGAVLEQVGSLPVQQHPLGFAHYELSSLFTLDPDRRVRLHVWSERSVEQRDEFGTIHAHNWHLKSHVLVGALEDLIIDAVPRPDGPYRLLRVNYGEDENTIVPLEGAYEAQTRDSRRVGRGGQYSLEPQVLHETRVLRLPTATLVLARAEGSVDTVILSAIEAGGSKRVRRPDIPPSMAQAYLQDALAALALDAPPRGATPSSDLTGPQGCQG
jgi:hypothetical protein